MQGIIMVYDNVLEAGVIRDNDGRAYYFTRDNWLYDHILPQENLSVDFELLEPGLGSYVRPRLCGDWLHPADVKLAELQDFQRKHGISQDNRPQQGRI
jgi:hypothetical protein